jgi:hypothetical protein
MDRKNKTSSIPGPLAMVATRAADPFLQYYLITSGTAASVLSRLGAISPAAAQTMTGVGSAFAVSNSSSIFTVGRLNGSAALVVGMTAVAAARHAYWVTSTRTHFFSVANGVGVGIYNALMSTINTGLLVWSLARQNALTRGEVGWKQWTGLGLFTFG